MSIVAFCICSCSGVGTGSPPTPPPTPPPALSITVSALPNGQVGHAYSAALTASGGTAPLSWSLSNGTVPAGLALAAATGAIAGTPTTTAAATPLTFTVSDSGSPPRSKSTTLPMTISPASITVTVTPRRAALTVQQTLALSASSNDYAGVSWSVAPAGCGSVSPATTPGSGAVTFTPPATAGACTVTATSMTDGSQSASASIGVTDLAGVYTYHNDLGRDGANTHEYALTPTNVSTASFGKLFACTVDGAIYAQPLWVANLAIGGGHHNVVFVVTQHDSLYAFDADANPCLQYWKMSLIDTAHGAPAPETSVPSGFSGSLVGQGVGGDIAPEVGVTGTPVIDPANNVLYVVSKSLQTGTTNIYQRLHAIDLATGNEKTGSPVTLAASYPTSGGGSPVTFNAGPENQRAGLAFANGAVYLAFGSHDDQAPWYGWLLSYTYGGSAFGTPAALNVAPDAGKSGIWMSGGAPSVDNAGNLYVITGNGTLDATSASAPNHDYGDSFLQVKPGSGLQIPQWFAPSDEANDDINNQDFGSGGSAIVLNLGSGTLRHLVVGGGKDGVLYVLNGDSMGNNANDQLAWQHFSVGGPIFATAAFWNNTLYLGVVGGPLSAFAFNANMNMFTTTPLKQSANSYSFPGPTPSISASGSGNGILWSLDNSNYCTPSDTSATPCAATVLHAYDALDLSHELWNSNTASGDAAGFAVKFTVPTIANGKVYVGTRGNDSFNGTAPTIPGELDVYGLKPD